MGFGLVIELKGCQKSLSPSQKYLENGMSLLCDSDSGERQEVQQFIALEISIRSTMSVTIGPILW